MPRKLEEVKKELKELKENTSLSIKEIEYKYNVLDKELDDLLNDKIKFSEEDSFEKEKESSRRRGIRFFSFLGLRVKNLC